MRGGSRGALRAKGTKRAGNLRPWDSPEVTLEGAVAEHALQLDPVPVLAPTLTRCVTLSKALPHFIDKEIKTQNDCTEIFLSCGLLGG